MARGDDLASRLGLFAIASVLLILLVVTLAFRSLLVALTVLAIAAIGYLVHSPLLGRLAELLGFEVPRQLEPVLLGMVTDYCVLFYSAFRDEQDVDPDNLPATRRALRSTAPVVAVAGLTVAGGTIALLATPLPSSAGSGPALALTVVVGLAVCLTMAPR